MSVRGDLGSPHSAAPPGEASGGPNSQISDAWFRSVVEAANEGIWIIDLEAQTLFANERMAAMLGTTPGHMIGRTPFDFLFDEDFEHGLAVMDANYRGTPVEFEIRFRRADGSAIPVLAGSAPLRDEDGKIIGSVATFSDLTARNEADLALIESEREAKRSAALLNQLLEAATDAIWMRDPAGVFRVANSAACRVMGGTHEEIVGRSVYEIWGPDVGAHLATESAAILSARKPVTVEEEMFDAGRGGITTFLSNKVPLYGDGGEPFGILGVSRDITERKRDEERERLLAREVDHRAKNLLAVVQSVVQLTQAGDAEELKAGIIGRIQSLARAHTLLADARWDGAQLGDLVREELAPYLDSAANRVTVDGPPLLLRPAAAQSLAMVLHELATNAVKYGALSSGSGKLDVEWKRTPDLLELSWTEHGGPAIKQPGENGFGTKIIRASIERQLHGELVQDWDPAGLTCTIRIKVGEALAASESV